MALNFNIPSQVKSFPTMGDFPATGEAKTIYIALDTKLLYIFDSGAYTSIGDATSAEWGHISGDITSQTDLQTALDGKFNNPTGNTTQYLNGAGTPTTFPTFASADKMVTVGRNSTGSTLYKGTIVYISGSTGNRPNFVKAQANSESTSAGTFGVIESDIANNADGNCVTIGTINDLDTRSSAPHPFTSDTLADGDTIYLSPTTAGYITKVKPSAPNHLVYLGKVVRTSPTNGTIVYRVQNGYELDEIHDVTTTNYTTPQDEDSVLTLDSTQLLWKRLTLFNLRVFLKTYFDTIYQSVITPGTTSQYYRGDKTFQTLDKTAVGLSNVDNTSDLSKPVSTAQATAIALKENSVNKATTMTGNTTSNTLFLTAKAIYDWATGLFQTILVSGTNIKTINGSSILGSGDLTISSSASWGGISGTLSSQTDLQTALNAKQATLTSGSNIKTINGNSVLGSGDININAGAHGWRKPASGQYIHTGVAGNGGTTSTSAGTAGKVWVYPFISAQDIMYTAININVSTGVAGALARIVIYNDSNGVPGTKIFESTDIDCSTTGVKSVALADTLLKGKTYWIGVHSSSTATFTAMPATNLLPLNYNGTSIINTHCITTYTYGSLPSTFGSPGYVGLACPYVFFTAS